MRIRVTVCVGLQYNKSARVKIRGQFDISSEETTPLLTGTS